MLKIIDLLNMISKGNIPNKIKYEDKIFILENMEYGKEYQCKEDDIIVVLDIDINCLNEKIEILSEQEKILLEKFRQLPQNKQKSLIDLL